MRSKFVVLSALLGSLALLGCLILLPGARPSRGQSPPAAEHENAVQAQIFQVLTPAPHRPTSVTDEQFLALDIDGDGFLSLNEMPEALRAQRERWDSNKDGFIDLAEWTAYRKATSTTQRPARRAFNLAGDSDSERPVQDGDHPRRPSAPGPEQTPRSSSRPAFIDNPHSKPVSVPSGKYPKNMPAWFKEYDTDGDGQIGLYEWLAKKDDPQEFRKYDLNGDGFITVEELVRSGQFAANMKAPQSVNGLQGEVGDFFYLEVKGAKVGIVWGTGVYTTDSFLATAAVHAGVLKVGETALVKITILAGQDKYEGSVRNEITSQPFGPFPKSFSIHAAK